MSDLLQANVVAKEAVAENTYAFTLEAAQGGKAISRMAGAHIDVHLPSGLVRQYSLTGLKRDVPHQLSIAVLREETGEGGSRELCDKIQTGDTLSISAPRNTFALDHGRDAYHLLAGGIGLTPILHMAIELAELGKPFMLDICARSESTIPFRDFLSRPEFAGRVRYHLSQGPNAARLDLADYIAGMPSGVQLYACGPGRMLDELAQLTSDWGMERLRTERFENTVEELSAEDSGSFTVELARSGKSFSVPEDKSILEMINELGVSRDSSCLEGVCGTCITDVVSGDIIHRDACLYDEEKAANSAMAVCVSRGKPGCTIVLDL
ncbi:PDR/VanB family oxidoreductase [Alterisphingorhabdus coralli]|uniref:PDR/VanB family oxidoreductase n=1 Tax=Alterisphingorhabdus coralli TaxID=3071408 RepID=A0AA97F656_9SPHN|nr:PDR/VanB family oxidoreductase [Parasphingorhabdus sp. SCSIO 66989]WOE74668.1 PDR/VanB family oxidoreductase [Parasphingorhabdus sp. SCSIO 66989]